MSDSFNLARLQNHILDIVRWRTKLGHRKWQDGWRQVRNVSRRTYEESFDVTDWMIGRSRSISRCYLHIAENCTNTPDHRSESHFRLQQYKLHDSFNIIFIIIHSFYECVALLFSPLFVPDRSMAKLRCDLVVLSHLKSMHVEERRREQIQRYITEGDEGG